MNKITEITRRDIFDLLANGELEDGFDESFRRGYNFWGRLTPVGFLSRLYKLDDLPSYDNRCKNAEEDIFRHTVANPDDYPSDWLFNDERFPLKNGSDEQLLDFLCEIFHPAVRNEQGEWKYCLWKINELLRKDKYTLFAKSVISGRPVYGWRDLDIPRLHSFGDAEVDMIKKFFFRGGYVLDMANRKQFSDFARDAIGVDLLELNNLSMGKSLLQFMDDCNEPEFLKICRALLKYYEASPLKELERNTENGILYQKICDKFKTFDSENVAVERQVEDIKLKFSNKYIKDQIDLMMKSQATDPTEAIGKAKELIESCCKTILEDECVRYKDLDLSKLVKETTKCLKITTDDMPDSIPEVQSIKAVLGSLAGIVNGLAALRNTYGSGHGKSNSYKGLSERHAKLAIGASSTLVDFLWATHERKVVRTSSDLSAKQK